MKETRFKDTEIGRIPEDWNLALLGDITKFLSNNTFSRDKLHVDGGKGEIKNIHYGDVLVKYGSILDVSRTKIPTIDSGKIASFCPENLAQDGDVIIADTAEDDTVCKVTELWNIGDSKVVSGLHTMWCRPDCNTFAVKYLGYFMNSVFYHIQILPLIQGIKVSSVSKNSIKDTWVCIPPLSEQTRIASALTSIDNLISSLDKLIEKKKAIKEGTMQQLLTGKKRLKGFNEPWVERKLGEIASMNSGGTPTSSNPSYYDGNINFLSISDMTASGKYIKATEKTITELGLSISSARLFPAGTLMYAMYASLGKCSISTIDTAISQAILGFKLSDQVERDFLYYHFSFIGNKVKTMGQTGTQSNLSKGIVKEFSINLPSLSEQRAIACVLSSMDNEISAIQAKKAKYESIKQGMMQQLLTGRIRLV